MLSHANVQLYHWPLSPPSRRVRLMLAEKNVVFESHIEKPWSPSREHMQRDPRGTVPIVLVTTTTAKVSVIGASPICEYFDEVVPEPKLVGSEASIRAEVRRLVIWFEETFAHEVTDHILSEKAIKRFTDNAEPDAARLRAGYANLRGHLEYIGWLSERRRWLAGDRLSLADLAAAAQLSVLDYLGDVPWETYILARDWYARMKSRPSFRPILGDHLAGLLPARHYANVDF